MKETPVLYGRFQTLVGILTQPDNPPPDARRVAVILANTGMIHRVGPNRIYVKLARDLAAQGCTVLRFDLSSLGDSLPRPDHMPAEQFTIDDLRQSMDYLHQSHGFDAFLLAGHCAGAFHAFRTAVEDKRVRGLVLINMTDLDPDWEEYDRKRKLLTQAQKYYGQKSLLDSSLWKRILRGQINYRAAWNNIAQNYLLGRLSVILFRVRSKFVKPATTPADEQLFTAESVVRKMPDVPIPALMIFSENATNLERLKNTVGQQMKQLQASGRLQVCVIPGADHIYTPLAAQKRLFDVVAAWVNAQRERLTSG